MNESIATRHLPERILAELEEVEDGGRLHDTVKAVFDLCEDQTLLHDGVMMISPGRIYRAVAEALNISTNPPTDRPAVVADRFNRVWHRKPSNPAVLVRCFRAADGTDAEQVEAAVYVASEFGPLTAVTGS